MRQPSLVCMPASALIPAPTRKVSLTGRYSSMRTEWSDLQYSRQTLRIPFYRCSWFEFDRVHVLQAVERDLVAGHLAKFIAWHIAIVATIDFRVFIGPE
jgi:hypothetical protein